MSFDPNAPTFPPPETFHILTCNPGPLLPLEAPPKVDTLPPLPSPPRKSLLDHWYTLSTHLIPAAYPRTTPFVSLPPLPKWTPEKEQFKAAVQKTTEHIMSLKERQRQGKLESQPPNRKPLWNCVNRYVRKGLLPAGAADASAKPGVTLFLAHANGFPKEIWEPTLQHLVSSHSANANYNIDEIWTWEAANHGDSCLVNAEALGSLYDWRDNARDILHFLTYYLPISACPEQLSTHLVRLPEAEAESRKARGLQGRNLLAVGHSFGGCTMARAAIEQPNLFRALFLLEAVIRPDYEGAPKATSVINGLVTGAIQRRDGWSSREEAHQVFATMPFFKVWDPAVLDIYVQCGLYEAPDGQIKLKMPGIQEAACFAEKYATIETFELLAKLDERVELRWLISGKIPSWEGEMRRKTAWRRPANSSHIRLLTSGHLIAQEVPSDLAKELHGFLRTRYGTPKALL